MVHPFRASREDVDEQLTKGRVGRDVEGAPGPSSGTWKSPEPHSSRLYGGFVGVLGPHQSPPTPPGGWGAGGATSWQLPPPPHEEGSSQRLEAPRDAGPRASAWGRAQHACLLSLHLPLCQTVLCEPGPPHLLALLYKDLPRHKLSRVTI